MDARWLKREYPDLFGWLTLIGAAFVGVVLSSGTNYHRLAIAVLTSAVAWLAAVGVFELLWGLVIAALEMGEPKPRDPERSP